MTIKQLDEFIEKTIKEQNKSKKVWLTLSLWETEDNDDIEFGDCQVFAPDLTSDNPIYEGKVIFGAGYPNKIYIHIHSLKPLPFRVAGKANFQVSDSPCN